MPYNKLNVRATRSHAGHQSHEVLVRAFARVTLLCLQPVLCLAFQHPEIQQLRQASDDRARARFDPLSVSYAYAKLDDIPAGVAGGRNVVFVGSPLTSRVLALSRLTGSLIGELPQPPSGFILPFIMHSIGPNRIAVLDAGGLPQPKPLVPANPTIYEYEYHYTRAEVFSASLVRTVSFRSDLIGFAEDIVSLGDGRYLLSDAALGALWIVNRDGTILPAIQPRSSDPADSIPELAFCPSMPLVTVGGIPFLFNGSTLPGIESLAVRANTLYFSSPCARGVYSIPLSALFDNRQPYERASDIRLIARTPSDVPVEQLLALTFNPYSEEGEPYLYAADSLQFRIIRINVRTGARQIIGQDTKLFNWPSSMAFLPPVEGISPLVVVSNQQHRSPLTNDAIKDNLLEPPFIATKVFVWSESVVPHQ